MKGQTLSITTTLIIAGYVLFLLGGCIGSSAQLHQYTLSPLVEQNVSTQRSGQQTLMLLQVVPPPWNTDSGIVTRSSSNSINASQTHLWAGTLQDQLTITLAENIRRLGGLKNVQVYPGSRFAKPDLLLEVEVFRFDGKPGRNFTCSAIWTVSDNTQKRTIQRKGFSTTVSVDSAGYTDYVAAASTAISQLSEEISLFLQKIRRAP